MSGQDFPEDIFTEPAEVDPDTLSNLGPLRRLAGTWEGRKGLDSSPKAEGPEERDYIERIVCEPIDPQANGPQLLYGLRYHIHITTEEEDITFHDQTGYWLWEPATGLVLQTVAIPRGQVALAKGQVEPGAETLVLVAERGQMENGIASSAFLEHAFRTDRYQIELTFDGDQRVNYVIETTLAVRGQPSFVHRDVNSLIKVAEPAPNPLMQILAAKAAKAPGRSDLQ